MGIEIVNTDKLIKEVVWVHNLAFSSRETNGKTNPYTLINEKTFSQMLNNPNVCMYAIVENDIVKGAICCTYTNEKNVKICGISHVCVDPREQRKGIARRLLEYAEKQAVEHKCQILRLNVGSIWKPALSLYLSFGFKKYEIIAHIPGTYYLFRLIKPLAPYAIPEWKRRIAFCFSKFKFAVLFRKDSKPRALHKIIYKK